MGLSYAEENYLKALVKLSLPPVKTVSTNAIAAHLSTSAASVTDMLKKLADKQLITYQRYQGASLTEEGYRIATNLVRKHRLWEVFLVQSLGMTWDEVHEIAEELEHIQSDRLIEKLDAFLGYPKFDPHGDPIPDSKGRLPLRNSTSLASCEAGYSGTVTGVQDHSAAYLNHLVLLGIQLGDNLKIISKSDYDKSLKIKLSKGKELFITQDVANNLMITKIK